MQSRLLIPKSLPARNIEIIWNLFTVPDMKTAKLKCIDLAKIVYMRPSNTKNNKHEEEEKKE